MHAVATVFLCENQRDFDKNSSHRNTPPNDATATIQTGIIVRTTSENAISLFSAKLVQQKIAIIDVKINMVNKTFIAEIIFVNFISCTSLFKSTVIIKNYLSKKMYSKLYPH